MALSVGELYVNILTNLDGVEKGFSITKKGLDEISKRADGATKKVATFGKGFVKNMDLVSKKVDIASKRMVTFGKTMTTKVSLPLGALGVFAVKTAVDIEGAISKFNVVFKGLEEDMRNWVTTFRKDFPLARGQIIKMSADLQDLLVPAGVVRDEAAGMTKEWFHLAGALAAFNDENVPDTLEAIRSGIAKQTEPLRRYGINATVAAVKQEALAMGILRTNEEMSDQIYQQALLSLAYKQSADAINGLEEQKGSLLWQIQELKADIIDLAEDLGKTLVPAVREGVEWISNGVEWFNNLDDSTKELIVRLGMITAAIGPVSYGLGRMAQGVNTTYKISKTFIGTSASLAKTIKKVMDGSESAATAFAGMAKGAEGGNVATQVLGKSIGWLAANPIALAIGAVGALTIAFFRMRDAEIKAHKEAVKKHTELVKQKINNEHDAEINALERKKELLLQGERAKRDSIYSSKEALTNALDDELKVIEKRHEAERQAINHTLNELEGSYQDRVNAIKDEYGTYEQKSESKIEYEQRIAKEAIQSLEDIKKVAKEQHDERIKQLEEQAYAQLSEEEKAAIDAIQAQIDAIDDQTKAEEKALREQADQKRIADLKERIANEEDAERRKELEEDLQEFLAKIERDKLLEKREAQKKSLRDEIQDVKTEYERKREEIKEGLNEELEDAKRIEELKLAETVKKVDEAIKEQERERDEKIDILIDERNEKLRIAEEEYNSAVEYQNRRLESLKDTQQKEIEEFENTRREATAKFEAMGYAYSTMQQGIRSETQNSIDEIDKQIAKIEEARKEALGLGEDADKAAKALDGIAKEAEERVKDLEELEEKRKKSIQDYWKNQGNLDGDIAPPAFHTGGVFKAPAGQKEGLALLKDNELVLTPNQQKNLLNGKSGAEARTITNNFNIANMNVADRSDLDRWAVQVTSMQGGTGRM